MGNNFIYSSRDRMDIWRTWFSFYLQSFCHVRMPCRRVCSLERVHVESGVRALRQSSAQSCYQWHMQDRRIHDKLFLYSFQPSLLLHWIWGDESVLQRSTTAVRFRWLFSSESPRMRFFSFPMLWWNHLRWNFGQIPVGIPDGHRLMRWLEIILPSSQLWTASLKKGAVADRLLRVGCWRMWRKRYLSLFHLSFINFSV